jgi:hypothetical protein
MNATFPILNGIPIDAQMFRKLALKQMQFKSPLADVFSKRSRLLKRLLFAFPNAGVGAT